jgi:hypothetical protein
VGRRLRLLVGDAEEATDCSCGLYLNDAARRLPNTRTY